MGPSFQLSLNLRRPGFGLLMILEDPKPSATERDPLLPSSGPSNGPGTTSGFPSSSTPSSTPRPSSSLSFDDDGPPAYTPPPEEALISRRRHRRSRLRKLGNALVVFAVLIAVAVLLQAGKNVWKRGSSRDDQDRSKPSPSSPVFSSMSSASPIPKRPPPEDGRSEEERFGRSWNESVPLPPTSHGFPLLCNPYHPSQAADGHLTSLARFTFPVLSASSLKEFFVRSASESQPSITNFAVEAARPGEEHSIIVEVDALFSNVQTRELVQVCKMSRVAGSLGRGRRGRAGAFEGEHDFGGIGIYTPSSHLDLQFKSIRIFVPPSLHLSIFNLIDLTAEAISLSPSTSTTFASLNVNATVAGTLDLLGVRTDSLVIYSNVANVHFEDVAVGSFVEVVVRGGTITGSGSSISLAAGSSAAFVPVSGKVLLTNITLGASSFIAPSHHPSTLPTTSVVAATTSGSIFLGFREDQPFSVSLNLTVDALLSSVEVQLPPSFNGSFHTSTSSLSRSTLHLREDKIPDPFGLGRHPRVSISKGKGNSYDGTIVWDEKGGEEGRGTGEGRVVVKTELGGNVLGMEEGWKGHEEKG